MTSDLGDRSGARDLSRFQLALVILVASAAVVGFYSQLLLGGALHEWDWSVHWHYYDWIRLSLTRYGTLPLYMADALHTPNFLANAQSPLLGPLVWSLYFLPTDVYIKLLVVLYATVGLVSMFVLLRDLDVEWPLAALVAVIFEFNGYFVSHICVGHHWSLGSFLLPAILCCYRRAVRGRRRYLWLAVAANVCSIFEGQHHPFIWNNVFLALYATAWTVETRDLGPLKAWVILSIVTVGVGAMKLLPMYVAFASYVPEQRLLGFSPVSMLWSLIWTAPDDHGYSLIWEYHFYIGMVAFVVLLVGLLAGTRRAWTWAAVGAFFLLIALDLTAWTPLPDLWSMLRELPVWCSQRCPARFLIVALTAFLIVAGLGLQALWERALIRWPRPRLLQVARVTLIVVYANLYLVARPWQRMAVGTPLVSRGHTFGTPAMSDTALRLKEFHPNRLIYEVNTADATRVLLPLPGSEWRPVGVAAEPGTGGLTVSLPAGKREIVVLYRPRFFGLGAGTTAATVIVVCLWEWRRWRQWSSKRLSAPAPAALVGIIGRQAAAR